MEPAKEGLPLVPLGLGPMEVDGAEQVPEDGATVGEATDEETDSLLQPSPEGDDCGLAHCCCRGFGVLLAGMYGVGWTCATVQNRPDRLTLEVGLCLDLSCLAPRPKEPLGLGPVACPAFESHLRPTFRPTLLTLERPGTPHCQEAGHKLDNKCPPQMPSWHRHLSQPARKTILGHSTIHLPVPLTAPC